MKPLTSRNHIGLVALGKSPRAILGATLLVVAGACSDDLTRPDPSGAGTLAVVVDGLDDPVFLTAAGDPDRLFIVEKPGRVRLIVDGVLRTTPFLDITSLVSDGGERGLLGLAFHPDYDANGYFFVNYTDTNGDTQIVRYSVALSGDEANPGSAQPVLSVPQPYSNHNGGQISFGPDQMLYVALGDGGSSGDPDGNGQDRETLLGSLLRIDVDGAAPYAVPPDNPFVGDASAAPEIWVYGLRNPWRFSFDRATGGLFIGDVGQSSIEEVSYQPPTSPGGENYGWNTMEGTLCFAQSNCDPTGLELPIHQYSHGDGCSITGGYVYRGLSAPSLQGRYFYADYCETWIRSFRLEGGVATDHFDHTDDFGSVAGIASFGEDASGELYVISISGTVYRIVEPE